MTMRAPRIIGQAPEIIFTCLKCEANYTVEQKAYECPVCGWRSKFAPSAKTLRAYGEKVSDGHP